MLGPIKLYGFDAQTLATVEKGECSLSLAVKTFEACYERVLAHYETAEEAVSTTSFGLYRSETDFIEISCVAMNAIRIHSDRLLYPSRISRWFTPKPYLGIEGDRDLGFRVIKDYFELEREAFESAYSKFACRRIHT
jgi:hypothetical protein